MLRKTASFIFSGIAWAVLGAGWFSTYVHAQQGDIISSQSEPAQTCAEARADEEERYRSQMIELQKAGIDATKDYNNRLLICKAEQECRTAARQELDEKRRSIQTSRNEVNAEHAKKNLDIARCRTKAPQPVLKPLQPKLDPRGEPDPSANTTWKDAYGNEYPISNRHVFTTPEGKQFVFPRTIEIGSDVYDLDTKSFQYKQASWGGWSTVAYYQNRSNPQDRTSRHGTLVQ